MTVRAVTAPADLEGARALLRTVGLPADDLGEGAEVRVLERGGVVVACVALEVYGSSGLVRSLAVAPSARGEGVGGRLVVAIEDVARARGLGDVYLLTTTAAPFFERRGYRPVDRADVPRAVRASSEFASVCPASAACLGKRLRP